MGTWGHSAFENDTALDWFQNDLESSDGISAIKSAIEAITSTECDDDIDGEQGYVAVAAAELVAALRGRPSAVYDSLVDEWLSEHTMVIPTSLVKSAVQAVSRVEANAALRELWGEAERAGPWRDSLADLKMRLRQKGATAPVTKVRGKSKGKRDWVYDQPPPPEGTPTLPRQNPSLAVGQVFQWDPWIVRILAVDEFEVHYDSYADALNAWMIGGGLRRSFSYYRTSVRCFTERTEWRYDAPLSSAELAYHRPDLPLRFYRERRLRWTSKSYSNREEYLAALAQAGVDVSQWAPLKCAAVHITPVTPKGNYGRPKLVSSVEGDQIDAATLLWEAHLLQAAYWKAGSDGIGFYRSGVDNGVPSYYIGHYYDAAGLLESVSRSANESL